MIAGRKAAIVLGLLLAAAGASATTAVRAVSVPITFETPSIVDPVHPGGEPDIGVDNQGRVFSSAPLGTGVQRSVWFGSVDGGHTYRAVNACPVIPSPSSPSPVGCPTPATTFNTPPGGGDTEIQFDRSAKQYFSDLYALACLRQATTTDGGATTNQQVYPAACGTSVPPVGADRQWIAVWDPTPGQKNTAYTGTFPLVYQEYNNLIGGGHWVKSNTALLPGDPGLTYTDATNGDTATNGNLCTDATNANFPVYSPFGADGFISIDQVTGKVFQANYSGSNILLNIGTPDANGNLTFLDAPTATAPCGDPTKLITVATGVANDNGEAANFVVSSIDSARNVYVTWVGRSFDPSKRQVFVSGASVASGWATWTTPKQVSDGAAPDAVNVFPWMKAGFLMGTAGSGAGRTDEVWYGSNLGADPSSHSGQVWNVFMNQAVFPVDGSGRVTGPPVLNGVVKVSPHPNHYDSICLNGTGCITSAGDRNLADFFEVNIDTTGAAEIVYDDTSNGLIQPGFGGGTCSAQACVDHKGAAVITVARQSSGMGLFGSNVSGPTNAPLPGLSDPAGDALYPVIGGSNVAAMDILNHGVTVSGGVLTVTMQVADLRTAALTAARTALPGTPAGYLQYVTRWTMATPGDLQHPYTIFYAAAEFGPSNTPIFYAGAAQSVDDCSVSACDPHAIIYPEPGNPSNPPGSGLSETTGSNVTCPASGPCTITVTIPNLADVGSPTATSVLEEVGGYTLATTHQDNATTNANERIDNVPLEIDGVCCYNVTVSPTAGAAPEAPWAALLPVIGAALVAGGAVRRRRHVTRQARGQQG